MKYRKKIILDKDIIHYLKYIYFEMSRRYCFEFMKSLLMVSLHLFVGTELKYYPSRVIKVITNITARKNFK